MARYFLTTAIDYPNGPPHIGHSLEKIAADVVARYHRLRGDETFFCMGLDENSQNVLTAAEANGVSAREWVDRMDEAFRLAWREVQCSYDRWIRTTEPVHFRASQELFRRAQAAGDIYKGSYSGYYCPNCNTFYSAEELTPQGTCPNHPTITPDWLEEENYFFALSRYTERLLRHVEAHPEFIVPATWRAEILNVLRSGLRDFSVSRPVRNQKLVDGRPWGVPVPGDPEHVIYVWFDALTNYLTAGGLPRRAGALRAHLAGGRPRDRQGHHPLPLPLLAGDAPLRRAAAPPQRGRARVHDPGRAAHLEDHRQHRRSGRAGAASSGRTPCAST